MNWDKDNYDGLLKRQGITGSKDLFYNENKDYRSDKNYQYIIKTDNVYRGPLYTVDLEFSMTPGLWNDKFNWIKGVTPSPTNSNTNDQYYVFYSSPHENKSGLRCIKISANEKFNNSTGISKLYINELDFNILGHSYYRTEITKNDANVENSLGWFYDYEENQYHWYDYVNGNPTNSTSSSLRGMFPIGGENGDKKMNIKYRLNNCLYKFVGYSYYNLSFKYYSNSSFNSSLKIYTTNKKPDLDPGYTWTDTEYKPNGDYKLLADIPDSYVGGGIYEEINFYGLEGNSYLLFVGGFAGFNGSSKYVSTYIKDLEVIGGYHNVNNTIIDVDDNSTSIYTNPLIDKATYSYVIGSGNSYNLTQSIADLTSISSRIGNGSFKAGVWENGVWNNGWRYDDKKYNFYDIINQISFDRNKKWRLQISCDPDVISSFFKIGDEISIGNIVGIDINENRVLLKDYFTVIDINVPSYNFITVEFINNFPLRRIEKDSLNHRIYVTKNVWLNGTFLNGYFNGIWNNGNFKGFPYITKMEDTQWIDGTFDGGHFKSNEYNIIDYDDSFYSNGYVGLTFSSQHNLIVGDSITIDKTNKIINYAYDGDHIIKEVPSIDSIVLDLSWNIHKDYIVYMTNHSSGSGYINIMTLGDHPFEDGDIVHIDVYDVLTEPTGGEENIKSVLNGDHVVSNMVDGKFSITGTYPGDSVYTNGRIYLKSTDRDISEGGKVKLNKSTGLIQKVNFKSNNISKLTSADSMDSFSVFVYNSWMDVLYDNNYATNIFKPITYYNKEFKNNYSQNNLYGYVTNDILQSISVFRDSYSLKSNSYSLGTKYKIFSDFIGDAGLFEEDFGVNTDSTIIDFGFTYSVGKDPYTSDVGSITFSRVDDKLEINVASVGSVINITNETKDPIINKTYDNIKKNRYTFIEFDLDQNNYNEYIYNGGNLTKNEPFNNIHFDNLNNLTKEVSNLLGTFGPKIPMSYLPVYENVNLTKTKKTKKIEYFYNKRDLNMVFRGPYNDDSGGSARFVIDNLHYYEVDMIPFFQYFRENNINRGVVNPYIGIADRSPSISPLIKYDSSNYILNSINITFTGNNGGFGFNPGIIGGNIGTWFNFP
jgi:hypothetical protein